MVLFKYGWKLIIKVINYYLFNYLLIDLFKYGRNLIIITVFKYGGKLIIMVINLKILGN